MDVQQWKKVISKKSQNRHNNGQVLSVATWKWHRIIKSRPFFRGLKKIFNFSIFGWISELLFTFKDHKIAKKSG